MGHQVDTEREIRELQQRRYWYQSVPIDGIVTPSLDGWAESRFYNRGKWDNFIAPLLPPNPDDLSFVELGSNAGLFLLLAAENGFGRVVGIEGDDAWMEQGCFVVDHYRRRDPRTYGRIELVHARLGPSGFGSNASCLIRSTGPELDLSSLGRADLFLAANVLYWIEYSTALRFIDGLSASARQCIVVSVEVPSPLGGPATLEELRAAFGNAWVETACIESMPHVSDDPAARPMFSVLFTAKGA
jgi:hypothetical protein